MKKDEIKNIKIYVNDLGLTADYPLEAVRFCDWLGRQGYPVELIEGDADSTIETDEDIVSLFSEEGNNLDLFEIYSGTIPSNYLWKSQDIFTWKFRAESYRPVFDVFVELDIDSVFSYEVLGYYEFPRYRVNVEGREDFTLDENVNAEMEKWEGEFFNEIKLLKLSELEEKKLFDIVKKGFEDIFQNISKEE